MPYVLEYLTHAKNTIPVTEKEVGEAEICGRLVKIPFRLNGQQYTYWTTYNRRVNSNLKYYAVRGDIEEDLNWCPQLPLTITPAELKCDKIDSRIICDI